MKGIPRERIRNFLFSWRTKLFAFVTLAAILPTMLIASILMVIGQRAVGRAVLGEQQEMARRVEDRIGFYMRSVRSLLYTVAERSELKRGGRPAETLLLQGILRYHPEILEVAVVRGNGQESSKVARRGGRILENVPLFSREQRPEFSAHLQGRLYVSPVSFSDGEPQLLMAVPISRPDGGMLLARLGLSHIQELISELGLIRSGLVFLVDHEGNLLAHPSEGKGALGKQVARNPLVAGWLRTHRDAQGLMGFEDPQGREWVGYTRSIPELDWGVIVQVPQETAFEAMTWMRQGVIWGTLFLCGTFLLIGGLLVRRLLLPLRRLEEGTRQIAQGQLKYRLRVKSRDEIGRLTQEFNRMAESLERLDTLKRDLIHMIVHDLKGPITGVIGSVRFILEEPQEELDAETKKLLMIADRAGSDLLRMIQNLLDLAKLEEGKLELRKDSFTLQSIIADCIDPIESSLNSQNKTISVEIPKNLPVLFADKDLIGRVLINLLQNALKYTVGGGRIGIRSRLWVEACGALRQSAVEVVVWDDGEGIPGEVQKVIFDKFTQAPRSGRGRVGAGLGLTFCRLAVEAHGGHIWVESEPRKGSRFCFSIPVVERAEVSELLKASEVVG